MGRDRNDEALSRDVDMAKLSARSVVASALLGTGSRGMRSRLVVRFAGMFDISEGATRVALSRMVAAGELESADGRYRVAGRMLERQRRQEASRRPRARRWDGSWTTALVKPDQRSQTQRQALHRALGHVRLAEYRNGVWMRPDNLVPDDLPEAEAVVAAHCERFETRPVGDPAALAERLWDLDGWSARARTLQGAMAHLVEDLGAGSADALVPGFLISAAVVRHVLADPLLPAPLLPPDWPGTALRDDFECHDAAWQEALRAWAGAQSMVSLLGVAT